jgi:hypothetical protein
VGPQELRRGRKEGSREKSKGLGPEKVCQLPINMALFKKVYRNALMGDLVGPCKANSDPEMKAINPQIVGDILLAGNAVPN